MDDRYAPHARRLGLTKAEPDAFTILRRKRGTGFRFIDGATGRSPGRDVTARLKALAAPPAWSDVRCSANERDHILMVGTDGDGRRQYIYHPDWEQVRDAVKAERLLRFGRSLPRIRERIRRDLGATASSDRMRVAALAARLVDRAAMRPGHEAYAEDSHRGVSTLGRGNVAVSGDRLTFDYKGKSGREHRFKIRDPLAARTVRRLKRSARRGRQLLVYKGPQGHTRPLTAAKLNRYLVDAAGEPVSAKDFRTFIGSTVAIEHLARANDAECERERRDAVLSAVRKVAERLRNTPAIARSSYVMPSIIEAYENGTLHDDLLKGRKRKGLDGSETALMRHLEKVSGTTVRR